MPKTPDSPITDGNAKQWDKLQAMRRKSGTALTDESGNPKEAVAAGESRGGDPAGERASYEERKAEAERLLAGESVGGEPTDDESETIDDEATDDVAVDDEADDEPEKVTVQAHERAKPKPKDVSTVPPPDGTEEVEIDGKKVFVAKELAQAFRDSEAVKVESKKTADQTALVDAVVDRVKDLLPKAPTPADEAAARALAEAEEAKETHPMPDAKLQVSDPDEFAKQLQAHIEEKADRVAKKVLAEQNRKDADARKVSAAEEQRRAEVWAREQLGIQFYKRFKVLDDPAVKPLVDVLLNKKFDDVIASGVFAKRLSPQEGEALKDRAFNDVAAQATRDIVNIRGGATKSAGATAPEPPKVATGAPNRGAKPKTKEEAPKRKEKYPSGSVSSWLADHQKAKREGRAKPA